MNSLINGWGSKYNYASAAWGQSPAYQAYANTYGKLTVGQYFSNNPGTVAVAQADGNDIYVDSTWVNSFSGVDVASNIMKQLMQQQGR